MLSSLEILGNTQKSLTFLQKSLEIFCFFSEILRNTWKSFSELLRNTQKYLSEILRNPQLLEFSPFVHSGQAMEIWQKVMSFTFLSLSEYGYVSKDI